MLRLEGVKKSFVEPNGHLLPVLDIPLFELGRSEQMVLLGRSGCGKTTLLHCIAGISTVDAGTINLEGVNLVRLSEAARIACERRDSATSFRPSICCRPSTPWKTSSWE